MITTFQDALKQIRAAKTVVRQVNTGAALKEMWAEALETVEKDVIREWNEMNARRRSALHVVEAEGTDELER